jgi:hypothetical protein
MNQQRAGRACMARAEPRVGSVVLLGAGGAF